MRFKSLAAATGAAFVAVLTLSADAAEISGAGATFPDPIYAKWSEAYQRETGTGLAYQSIGSAGGIKQIVAKTVTFGASDKPLDQNELEASGLIQFPMIMGGIVPVLNVEASSLVTSFSTGRRLPRSSLARSLNGTTPRSRR